VSILEVADLLAEMLERKDIGRTITYRYRKGDIRHCFADIGLARSLLGYEPQVRLEAGVVDFVEWLEGQTAVDHLVRAQNELLTRRLAI
jgi:dTDP-L-rhamnose 4-epimerase